MTPRINFSHHYHKMPGMTLHEAWSELCAATRTLLWNYSPETIFLAGLMIGAVAGLLLVVVTFS